MKTRQEMIYDFMIALSANPEYITNMFRDPDDDLITGKVVADAIAYQATHLADVYLMEIAS
jgi:hypothetical protein